MNSMKNNTQELNLYWFANGFVRGQVSGASARVLTAEDIVNNVMVKDGT